MKRIGEDLLAAICKAARVHGIPAAAMASIVNPKTVGRILARPVCNERTLAPDDLVVPCILPAGHAGFHFTGR